MIWLNRRGRLIVQLKQSAEEQKNAELQALEAQIDPHFLLQYAGYHQLESH